MALPVLGIVARLILKKGFKKAVKKYGKKAAEKGTKEIEKRDKELLKKIRSESSDATTAAERQAQYTSPRLTEIARETRKVKARDKRLVKERDSMLDKEGDLIPEAPLKFAEGGVVGMQGGRKVPEVSEDSLTLDTVLFEDDKEKRTTVRSALASSRPEEVFAYVETGNKEWLRSGVEDWRNEGRPDWDTYAYLTEDMPDDVAMARLQRLNSIINSGYKVDRTKKAEGGDVDNQMNALMPVEETSADEEDRDIEAQMEELEAAKFSLPAEEDMMPDEQMEDEYLDFVISQSLSPEEETALMNKLEADPELSVMFDKIMDTAIEFSGSGPVEGPGSEVSDSIPARLSDGEFVFTSKAADQIGSERLQSMMEDAEVEADDVERQKIALGGSLENKSMVNQYSRPIDGSTATEEIKKSMLSINPRLR